jgi:hypothetical protein
MKRRRLPVSKATPENGHQEPRRVLYTATPQEVALIQNAITQIQLYTQQLNLARLGLQFLWRELREVHDLPEKFDFDPQTGECKTLPKAEVSRG